MSEIDMKGACVAYVEDMLGIPKIDENTFDIGGNVLSDTGERYILKVDDEEWCIQTTSGKRLVTADFRCGSNFLIVELNKTIRLFSGGRYACKTR